MDRLGFKEGQYDGMDCCHQTDKGSKSYKDEDLFFLTCRIIFEFMSS